MGSSVVGAVTEAISRRSHRRTGSRSGLTTGSLRRERCAGVLAFVAVIWTAAAAVSLFFAPMGRSVGTVTGSEAGTPPVDVVRETSPLVAASGVVQVIAVAVALGFAVIMSLLGTPSRPVLYGLGFAALVLCVITGFTIGTFFLPVPFLLLIAAGVKPAMANQPSGRAEP